MTSPIKLPKLPTAFPTGRAVLTQAYDAQKTWESLITSDRTNPNLSRAYQTYWKTFIGILRSDERLFSDISASDICQTLEAFRPTALKNTQNEAERKRTSSPAAQPIMN